MTFMNCRHPSEIRLALMLVLGDNTIPYLVDALNGRTVAEAAWNTKHHQSTSLKDLLTWHVGLLKHGDAEGVRNLERAVQGQMKDPTFWNSGADDLLSSVAGTLSPMPYASHEDQQFAFNTYCSLLMKIALRPIPAGLEGRMAAFESKRVKDHGSGTVTKHIGIAFSDHHNQRLSHKHLLSCMQDCIHRGDVLLHHNADYVTNYMLPLVRAGVLFRSRHVPLFEQRLTALIAAGAFEIERPEHQQNRDKPWWRFW